MGWLERKTRGFSCPQEAPDEAFVALLGTIHARETVRFYLDRYGAEIKKHGEGLVGLLETWLGNEVMFETVWDPAFADAYGLIRASNPRDVTNVAAALGLRLGACGMVGEWDLRLERKGTRLRWDRWLLPAADWICVSSNGEVARVCTRLDSANHDADFRRTDDGWKGEGADSLVAFGARDRKITFLPREALVPEDFQDLLLAEAIEPKTATACEEAIALLRTNAPIYLPWVDRILRYIILLQHEEVHRSGSFEGSCGVIQMSDSHKPILLAETLVHEACHQYFHLLCWLGPVDDGTDANLYYSPIVRAHRPLKRIALAYHAFGNILLLYRLFRSRSMVDGSYCSEYEECLTPQLDQLEIPLRNNPALTSVGRALCDPLIERIH